MLLLAVLFGSGYWYYTASAICDVPIAYRVGSIDSRFGITREEVRAAVSTAESLWEDATGRNLFTFDGAARLSINFIFDERQQEAIAEQKLREELEDKEGESDQVKQEYEELLDEYDSLKGLYEEQAVEYEKRLRAHNAEVAKWNEAGGAPPDVYGDLSRHQEELAADQKKLNTIAYELNELVEKMNAIGDEGNSLISDYNEVVDKYNSRFHESHEFTQGDYQGDAINIYQYNSTTELEIVLAHEFGHALNLEHVEGTESIMYHFMEAQTLEEGITDFDLGEFERVCGDGDFTLWSIL